MAIDPKRPTVFILGAGASYGARHGLEGFCKPPPLGNDLARYLRCWLKANHPDRSDRDESAEGCDGPQYERHVDVAAIVGEQWGELERWLARVCVEMSSSDSPHSFEEYTAALANEKCREKLKALNRLIGIAMVGGHACRFDYGEDRFDALLLRFTNLSAVITLNYDVLLEWPCPKNVDHLGRTERSLEEPWQRRDTATLSSKKWWNESNRERAFGRLRNKRG